MKRCSIQIYFLPNRDKYVKVSILIALVIKTDCTLPIFKKNLTLEAIWLLALSYATCIRLHNLGTLMRFLEPNWTNSFREINVA